MSFAMYHPDPPPGWTNDVDRKLPKRVWNLGALQAALRARAIRFTTTTSADHDLRFDLNWTVLDGEQFFLALGLHRYGPSEWCLPPHGCNHFGPLPADVYVMGYDRINGVEHQHRHPWIYIKFAVTDDSIVVFSLHTSKFC